MPNIGVRLTPLQQRGNTAGAGMAAGLERAREIKYDEQAFDAREEALEQQEMAAEEERAAHQWLQDDYAKVDRDEMRQEAFAPLSIEMKQFVLGQRKQEMALERTVQGAQEDLQFLGSHPRGQRDAEMLQALMETPGADPAEVVDQVRGATDRLKQHLATENRAMGVLQEGQTFIQGIQQMDPSKVNPEMGWQVMRLQQHLEAQQNDPNAPPLTEERLEEYIEKIDLHRAPPKALESFEAEIAERVTGEVMAELEGFLGEELNQGGAMGGPPAADPELMPPPPPGIESAPQAEEPGAEPPKPPTHLVDKKAEPKGKKVKMRPGDLRRGVLNKEKADSMVAQLYAAAGSTEELLAKADELGIETGDAAAMDELMDLIDAVESEWKFKPGSDKAKLKAGQGG